MSITPSPAPTAQRIALAAPTVAALFVEDGGCYFGLPNVDPWPESRDARAYPGPWPAGVNFFPFKP